MLKKTHRITSARLISLLFKKGKMYKGRSLIIRFLPSLHSVNQFVIIVSKKVAKNAVDRNRLKRQVSEGIRLHISNFKEPIVASLIVKQGQAYHYATFEKDIESFIEWYQKQIQLS